METSPLSNLSPELRNQIYTYVLDNQIINLDTQSHIRLENPLVQTCRQIRSETLSMDLGNKKITPSTFPHDSDPIFPSRLEQLVVFLVQRRCKSLREIDLGAYRIRGLARYEEEKAALSQKGAGNEIQVFPDAYAVPVPIVQANTLEQVERALGRVGMVLHSVRVRVGGRFREEKVFVMAAREEVFGWAGSWGSG
ncbi:hypothetical protein KC330_g8901 [Hortaea werneckii]|nr:hypothetical protein KC330_g8901 [Hortaea werneckii]